MDDNPENFIDRKQLKIALIQKGMSQNELAIRMGVDKSVLSLKINGKRNFSEDEIKLIQTIFGNGVFSREKMRKQKVSKGDF